MKNIILFITLSSSHLMAQFGYPLEDFLGGGIGYSPMYIKLDSIPGSSDLMGLGLDPKNFDDPFVMHGARASPMLQAVGALEAMLELEVQQLVQYLIL